MNKKKLEDYFARLLLLNVTYFLFLPHKQKCYEHCSVQDLNLKLLILFKNIAS